MESLKEFMKHKLLIKKQKKGYEVELKKTNKLENFEYNEIEISGF